jgi:hypothetical protein
MRALVHDIPPILAVESLAMHSALANHGPRKREERAMPLVILTVAAQVLAVVHLFRTGRDMRWLFLIILVPAIGCLAYFFIEVLPSLRQSPAARRAMRAAKKAVDPNQGVRQGALDYERSQNVETAARLAEELTKAGRYEEAMRVCNDARRGLFEDDPKILLALATAQFAAGDHAGAISTLDYLREKNPSFRSADGHLVYARALEESAATDRALEEYAALVKYYPGAEARVRQAMLLKKLGRLDEARALFDSVLDDGRLAPKHFQRSQREWLDRAARERP